MFDTNIVNEEYMQIVLTHACNRKCKFCIDLKRGADEFLTEASLRRSLAFAKDNGTKDILFIGGEPTLHPQFRKFAEIVKTEGINLICTTNFDNPDIILANMDIVDSWNFSYYGQKEIPFIEGADITLSALIYAKGFLNTKEKLDAFIDKYEDKYHLKFSTLSVINDYTAKFSDPGDWIDEIPGERFVIFDFVCAQNYRGHVIKRYDIENPEIDTLDSFKCLVDGTITRSWTNDPRGTAVEGLGALPLAELQTTSPMNSSGLK